MSALGRPISPDSTRGLWGAIRALGEGGTPATAENVAARLAPASDWANPPLDTVQNKLHAALEYGLITSSLGPDSVPVYGPVSGTSLTNSGLREPPHDWYCFECHQSTSTTGNVVGCSTCFRVYHPLCLNMPELEGAEFSCPVCVSVEKPTSLDSNTLRVSLDSILMGVFKDGGSALGEAHLGSKLSREEYQALVARDMDLAAMRTKLDTGRYPTPRDFFADFQLLLHNVALAHGKDAELSRTAHNLLVNVRAQALVARDMDLAAMRTKLDTGRYPTPRDFFADFQLLLHNVALAHGKDAKLSRTAHNLLVNVRAQIDALEEAEIEPGENAGVDMEVDGVGRTTATLKARPPGLEEEGGWAIDDRFKKMLMDLQRYWLTEYQQSREKLLVELTEKLHSEFVSDQAKIRTELLTQFKDELDTTRQELEQKYKDNLRQEMAKATERHKKDISAIKKKQWCWQCEAEAIYHCCWNTAYCSVECQQAHWPTHRKYCRRKKPQPNAPAS